jgi:hypothetical protein
VELVGPVLQAQPVTSVLCNKNRSAKQQHHYLNVLCWFQNINNAIRRCLYIIKANLATYIKGCSQGPTGPYGYVKSKGM